MKLTTTELNKLKTDVLIVAPLLYPEWRLGQAYFNFLIKDYPTIAEEIRGTEYDPYYADHKDDPQKHIDIFLKYISLDE